MPKNLTARGLVLENLNVQTDESDAVIGLNAGININYGETSLREQFDLWAVLTSTQRSNFQEIHNALTQLLQSTYIS